MSFAPMNCSSSVLRLGEGVGLVNELGPGDLFLRLWEGRF